MNSVPTEFVISVYVDALIPKNGQSNFDILDKPVADLFRKIAVDGWRMEMPADVLLPYLGIDTTKWRLVRIVSVGLG